VPFPAQWDTSLSNFLSEPEFNAILTSLGRLAAADANLEQEIFDPRSYLVNKNDYAESGRFVEVQDQAKASRVGGHSQRCDNLPQPP
jgi:hypothetical protein